MKLQVGKCYILTSYGKQRKFRVVKNVSNAHITIRDCETKHEEDFLTDTNKGGFSPDFTIKEFDCMDCDGEPSL